MTFIHGTAGGYTNHKCRCDLCKKANSDICKKYRNNNAEKIKTKRAEFRKSNIDALRIAGRKHYAENAEKIRASDHKRYLENPNRRYSMWLKSQRRRAIEKEKSHGCVVKNTIDAIILLNNNSCVYCGGPYEHIDHIMPLTLGGMNCIENLTTACARCNMSKGAKLLENWLTDTIDIKTLNCELGETNG
jgi:5-methylcytosine-specific restriction endonuclease McrA